MYLRNRGIYCLPNGRELVVIRSGDNGNTSYKLCSTTSTTSPNGSGYEVSDDGRLICEGRLTAWDISNLSDTGRTFDSLTAWF
jgi:large exoprotein involved in heme utilization and adhesion